MWACRTNPQTSPDPVVHLPEYGKNAPYLTDFIRITLSSKLLNSEEIRKLYVEDGLSMAQIARQFRVARTVILARLHAMGIEIGSSPSRTVNPENYRQRVPPYGYQIQAGKLIPNKRELQVCKAVIELIDGQGKNHSDTARALSQRGFKNRAGNLKWNTTTISNIHKRWKGKI